jgi:hypothetical protein
MCARGTIGPGRIREILRRSETILVVPLQELRPEANSDGTMPRIALSSASSASSGILPPGSVHIAGGGEGLARLLGDTAAGAGSEAEVEGDEGLYHFHLSRQALDWVADRTLLWRVLAGVYGPGQPEVSSVDSGELAQVLSSGREVVRHCRAGDIGWIVVETVDTAERSLAKALQRLRDLLRSLGLNGVEVRMERRPTSTIRPGTPFLRLATPGWVAYWPAGSLNRLLISVMNAGAMRATTAAAGAGGEDNATPVRENGAAALQRAVALRMCDQLLRTGGIGALVLAIPRTSEERRGRYAVRTVQEILRAGGIAPRILVETAYRSGDHYRALATMVAGLSRSDRAVVQSALGRRRWEQLVHHGRRGTDRRLPWVAFVGACETMIGDLADRARRPGYSPPPAVTEIVNRFYSAPREERLHHAWRDQIKQKTLERVLEAARLSLLRSLLRRLPRDTLLLAGCGDSREVQMRISATYSRRGRTMYLEDVAVLEERINRREMREWETLLAARLAVRAAAERAVVDGGGSPAALRTRPSPRNR